MSLFSLIFRSRTRGLATVPGPSPWFPFGNLGCSSGKNPWDVVAGQQQNHGNVFVLWGGWKPVVCLHDGELIREVLETRHDEFYKDFPGQALAPVIRDNMFVANSPKWDRMRQNDPFLIDGFDDWLSSQQTIVSRGVQQGLRRVLDDSEETSVDLTQAMQRASFDAVHLALLGIQLSESDYNDFVSIGNTATRRMLSPLQFLPPFNPFFKRAQDRWYAKFLSLVVEARQKGTPTSSPMELIRAIFPQREELTDEELANVFASIAPGGVFTFAAVLATTLRLLCEHPEELLRLRSSLEESNALQDGYPALKTLASLDFVLRESMRICPPVPMFARNVGKDHAVQLGEYSLPADTMIMISNQVLHRSKDHWGDPDVFRPDRWDHGVDLINDYGSDYFFPFGRGPRTCVSFPFSMFFLRVALATILTSFDVKLSDTPKWKEDFYFGIVRPKKLHAVIREN